MVELRHLSGFVAVAEELHFGRAAERTHIAQSPLSQQIRLLERDLGVKLFDRTTRSVRLTAAGQALLGPARHLLAEASAVRRTVQAAHLGEVGRVTVGFAGAGSYSALPVLTRAVGSELPGIELVLEGQTYTGEALGRIMDGSLDIGCEQFGRPIAAFQLTQQKLVDMALELHKATLTALHLARLKDGAGVHPAQISFGKLNNVREALEICRIARTVLGANGISLEYPVIRHTNDLESVLTYEGTTEMHTLALGQALTGHAAFR